MGKRDEILDAAEHMVRETGFHAVSFRDLASATKIKSASVHYHFPTKDDLGEALTQRYAERFIGALPRPEAFDGLPSGRVVETMRLTFKEAYQRDGQMCLCGILGTEAPGLPDRTRTNTKAFFTLLTDWIKTAFSVTSDGRSASGEARTTMALTLIARLEGAMLLARGADDPSLFDRVTQKLT